MNKRCSFLFIKVGAIWTIQPFSVSHHLIEGLKSNNPNYALTNYILAKDLDADGNKSLSIEEIIFKNGTDGISPPEDSQGTDQGTM